MTAAIPRQDLIAELPSYRWSVEKYHALIEAGVLNEYSRVELLFGHLITMSPVGFAHAKHVKTLNELFMRRFLGKPYSIGVQDPITLGDFNEPEPDLFVAKGFTKEYNNHPKAEDVLLVIEVSDTTLNKDRTAKKAVYATAGIQEYWIINVFERQVECFTHPNIKKGIFGREEILREGGQFSSISLGDFQVSDLVILE